MQEVTVNVSKEDRKLLNITDDMAKDIHDMQDALVKDIKGTKSIEIVQDLDKAIKTLPDVIQKELSTIKGLIKSRLTNDAFKKKPIYARLNKKQKTLIAVGAMTVATGASANDGTNNNNGIPIAGILFSLVALGVAFPSILKVIDHIKDVGARQTIKNAIKKINDAHAQAELKQTEQGKNMNATKRMILDSIHTRFTSTVAPFIKAGGKAKEIILKLTFSAEFGSGALELKQRLIDAMFGKYAALEEKMFKQWKQEHSIGFVDGVKKRFDLIKEFRIAVTDHIDGLHTSDSKSIQEMAKLVNGDKGLMQDFFDTNKAHGTYGFDKLHHVKGMIPRLWKNTQLVKLMQQLSVQDQLKVRDAIARAINKSQKTSNMKKATAQADKFVNSWKEGYNAVRYGEGGDIYNSLAHLLKDDTEVKDITDALITKGDKIARAKGRIPLDIKDLQDEINGLNLNSIDFKLTLHHFIERDIKAILDKTSNTMYAASALSAHGFTSFKALDDAIKAGMKTYSEQMQIEMQQIADMVKGIPIEVNNPLMDDISNMMKDITLAGKLPLVALSTPTEIISTLANGNIFKTLKTLTKSIVNEWGEDSELVRQLSDITGFGRNTNRMDISYYGYSDDMIDLTDVGVANKLRMGTMKLRDGVIYGLGLSGITDILQRANMVMNTERFAKFIRGDNVIAESDLKSLNILPSDKTLFKGLFKFNNKDKLMAIDMNKLTIKQRDRLNQILFNMNQKTVPETTAGETPLFSRTDSFGRMITTLMGYSLHQFNTHGLQDLRNINKNTFIHAFSGIAGTWVSLQMRAAATQKPIDDKKAMLYSILNIPQLLGVSVVNGLTHPPVIQVSQAVMSVAGTMVKDITP